MTHPTDDEIICIAMKHGLQRCEERERKAVIPFARALLAEQARPTKRQTYKPGNGGACSVCGQPEGDHYRHGNDCPDMRGVEQST